MTFTLASVNPVSDIVGIPVRVQSSGRQRPELHTTRSKQNLLPLTFCFEGFLLANLQKHLVEIEVLPDIKRQYYYDFARRTLGSLFNQLPYRSAANGSIVN
jgi:hypothetical protein